MAYCPTCSLGAEGGSTIAERKYKIQVCIALPLNGEERDLPRIKEEPAIETAEVDLKHK